MSKEGVIITLGVIVTLLPFLGIPYSWYGYFLPVFGLVSAVLALMLLRVRRQTASIQAPLPFTQYEAPPSRS